MSPDSSYLLLAWASKAYPKPVLAFPKAFALTLPWPQLLYFQFLVVKWVKPISRQFFFVGKYFFLKLRTKFWKWRWLAIFFDNFNLFLWISCIPLLLFPSLSFYLCLSVHLFLSFILFLSLFLSFILLLSLSLSFILFLSLFHSISISISVSTHHNLNLPFFSRANYLSLCFLFRPCLLSVPSCHNEFFVPLFSLSFYFTFFPSSLSLSSLSLSLPELNWVS